jgi:hypothetical protein
MFDDMAAADFPRFLSAFWEDKGWDTSVKENEDGTFLVAGDKSDGTRGLIGVRPTADTEIGSSEVEDFAAFCDKKGVDVRVMATRGRFTTGARSAADAGDVHLLDPNELASAVRDEGAEDIVSQFTGGGGGSLFDNLPDVPITVPSGLPSGIPVVPIAIAAIVVFAAVFAGGTVMSLVPFVGGGAGASADGGPAVTAFSLDGQANATATVAWDSEVTDSLSSSTGDTYEAPDGETFLVVRMEVTSPANQSVVLRGDRFALRVNGSTYGYQRLSGTTNMLPVQVQPGNTTQTIAVFSVPEGFEGATLVAQPGDPGIRFVRADLSFELK